MIFELFSQRNSKKQEFDVYEYENLSQEFRNQVLYILSDYFKLYKDSYKINTYKIWENINQIYLRQKGLKRLTTIERFYSEERDAELFFYQASYDQILDYIDLSFQMIDSTLRKISFNGYSTPINNENEIADKAIQELNFRFKQHGLGYEFSNGNLVKKTNELIHQEIIKPALKLLHNKRFKGSEDEFLKAFEDYKNGNNKDALMNAQRAFESTLKCICKEKKIKFKDEETSRPLIKHLIEEGFIPTYQDNYMNNLEQILCSGLPTVRKKEAGHGQGVEIRKVDNTLVEYAINMSATNIVYLVSLLNKK